MKRKRGRAAAAPEGMVLSMKMVKGVAGAVVVISMIVGTAFAIDSRYASAESVRQLRVDIELLSVKNRKQTVEDKLFDLQQKPARARTPRDDALIQRYERELRDVNQKIHDLEKK